LLIKLQCPTVLGNDLAFSKKCDCKTVLMISFERFTNIVEINGLEVEVHRYSEIKY